MDNFHAQASLKLYTKMWIIGLRRFYLCSFALLKEEFLYDSFPISKNRQVLVLLAPV